MSGCWKFLSLCLMFSSSPAMCPGVAFFVFIWGSLSFWNLLIDVFNQIWKIPGCQHYSLSPLLLGLQLPGCQDFDSVPHASNTLFSSHPLFSLFQFVLPPVNLSLSSQFLSSAVKLIHLVPWLSAGLEIVCAAEAFKLLIHFSDRYRPVRVNRSCCSSWEYLHFMGIFAGQFW